jgi:hypothetical protein
MDVNWVWIVLGVAAYSGFVAVVMRFCAAVKRADAAAADARRRPRGSGLPLPERHTLTVADVLSGARRGRR